MSALESVAGAVRVSRFDHSSLDGFDGSSVDTGLYKMEYVIHFHGPARPANLPLLGYTVDASACGETASDVTPTGCCHFCIR